MKRLILTTAFVLLAGITFGQTLEKGNSLGLHVYTITLDPDVTLNQWLDFYSNKLIPEFEKNFEGLKINLLKGDRGRYENKVGILTHFKSEKDRDRYWPEFGEQTDEGKAGMEKVQPVLDELAKLGTMTDEYSGFVIQ
jgi:hypothetical protein